MEHETEAAMDAIEALLPAYALNALDEEDRAMVEGALAQEPRYREHLAEYLAAVAQLVGMHAPAVPSAALRDRVLASRSPLAVPLDATLDPPVPAARPRRLRSRTPVVSKAWAAAAAVVLAVTGLGAFSTLQYVQVLDLREQMDTVMADAEETEQRLTAQQALVYWVAQPEVATIAMRGAPNPTEPVQFGDRPGGPRGLLMQADGQTVLVTINLAPLPEHQSYQAWAYDSLGRPHSLGVFEVDENGYAQVLVDYPQQAGEPYVMRVSVEPPGGSTRPSGLTVLMGIAEVSG